MEGKPDIIKALSGAFGIGAVFGAINSLLVMVLSNTPLYAAGLSTVFSLGLLGIAGIVLWYAGFYAKLESVGGMGATLPFCGLAAAIADMVYGIGREAGTAAKGIKAVLTGLLGKVMGVTTVICCILAVVVAFTGFGIQNMLPYTPGGVIMDPGGTPVGTDPLVLLWGFLFGGCASAFFQALARVTKLPLPKFLLLLMVLGGLLTPLGIMKVLVSICGGAVQLTLFGYSEAVVSTFAAFTQGIHTPFLALCCVVVFLFGIGIAAGMRKLHASGPSCGEKGTRYSA